MGKATNYVWTYRQEMRIDGHVFDNSQVKAVWDTAGTVMAFVDRAVEVDWEYKKASDGGNEEWVGTYRGPVSGAELTVVVYSMPYYSDFD